MKFVKVEWGSNRMTYVEAGGEGNRVRKQNLEQYTDLANVDERIVAFSMHPDGIMASFYTYLAGNTSPKRHSWPVYVREDLIDSSWRVGFHVDIGDPTVEAPSPSGL